MHQQTTPPERWLPVVGFEGFYEVSDHGRLRSVDRHMAGKDGTRRFLRGRLLNPTPQNGRAAQAKLRQAGRYHYRPVRWLVLQAFVGPRPSEHQGAHGDGDPSNNRLDNLRWATVSENQKDRVLHGTSNRGEQCGAAKLTPADVVAVRESRKPDGDLATLLGVSPRTINDIRHHRTWRHV